jgi:hypothetical protein
MTEKKAKLAVNKTQPTAASVENFLNSVTPEQKRKDSFVLLEMKLQCKLKRYNWPLMRHYFTAHEDGSSALFIVPRCPAEHSAQG